MKLRLFWVNIIVILMFLYSCSSDNDIYDKNDIYNEDIYIYMTLRLDDDSGSLINRFNTETGEVTVVCPDPLCEHNVNECMFASGAAFYVYNNYILVPFRFVYDFDTGNNWYEAEKYDLITQKIETFYNYGYAKRANTDFSFFDGYMYGGYLVDNTSENSKKLTGETIIFRYDVTMDEIEYLNYLPQVPIYKVGERYYYFSLIQGHRLFSTDLKGKDIIEYNTNYVITSVDFSKADSGIIHCIASDNSNMQYVLEIWTKTGECNVLVSITDKTVITKICGDYIYYIPIKDPVVIGHDDFQDRDIINRSGGILMRKGLYNGETETVYELGNDYCLIGPIYYVNNKIVIDYGGFDEHELYHIIKWFETGGGKIVYDTITGEYTIYSRTWNKPAGYIIEQNIF